MTRRSTTARVNAAHRATARRLVKEYVDDASDGHIGMCETNLIGAIANALSAAMHRARQSERRRQRRTRP